MSTTQIILVAVFIIVSIIGYLLINNVPSLLHTPLMSGMNALSGVTVLGALISTALAVSLGTTGNIIIGYIFGGLAIICAMVNVVGGFGVTERMLKMIARNKKKQNKGEQK